MSDVFIIGAGCSVPYGFPTGAMLMQKLKNFDYGDNNLDNQSFSPPSYLFDIYHELFGKYQEYRNFKKAGRQYTLIPFGAIENGKYQEFLKKAQRVYFLGFSYIPDNLNSIGIDRGAEIIRNAKVYATAMGLSSQNRLRISTYLDLMDFEKRNESEPMLEIEVPHKPFKTIAMRQQQYEEKERIA
jgi:hypothetical protein